MEMISLYSQNNPFEEARVDFGGPRAPGHRRHHAQTARGHDAYAPSLVRLCRIVQLTGAQRAGALWRLPESVR